MLLKALTSIWAARRRADPPADSDEASHAALAAFELLSKNDVSTAAEVLSKFLGGAHPSADVVFVQGCLHKARGEFSLAAERFRQACELREGFAAAWAQLADIHRSMGELERALAALEQAATYQPNSAVIQQNLGITQYQLREVTAAIAALSNAVSLDPSLTEARFNLAEALLSSGEFQPGWREYEYRPGLETAMIGARMPRWQRGMKASRISVIAEQGLGDILLFARLLPRIHEHAPRVRVFVPRQAVQLLRESKLGDEVVSIEELTASQEDDTYVPFMSLPEMLALGPQQVDASVAYLSVASERTAKWAQRTGPRDDRMRVGLVWAGNASHRRDFDRSIDPIGLAPLGRLERIAFYSLQMGRIELGRPPLPLIDLMPAVKDLADTAALIAQLDLVITVDTVVAHLAGGLGHPVWVLCPLRADWRWEIAGHSSPWYASARIFRSAKTAEWTPVIARVADALDELSNRHVAVAATPNPPR